MPRAPCLPAAGTYRITKQITIPSRIVLRGAGRGRTTLLFPHPLSAVYGTGERPDGTTEYTRGRFWIQFEGIDRWFEDRWGGAHGARGRMFGGFWNGGWLLSVRMRAAGPIHARFNLSTLVRKCTLLPARFPGTMLES